MVRYADSSAIRLLELRDLQMDNHRHAKGFCYITTLGFVGGDLTGEEWLICLLPVCIIYDLTISSYVGMLFERTGNHFQYLV